MIANAGLYCASGELLEEFGKKKKKNQKNAVQVGAKKTILGTTKKNEGIQCFLKTGIFLSLRFHGETSPESKRQRMKA
jgi:hypothetical protein